LWSEDVLVTRKKACRLEAISRCRACCSFLVCVSEHFTNLVDGDDSPWVWMEQFFNILAIECFRGDLWKLYPRVAFCGCCEVGGKLWKRWALCNCPFPCSS
jgi:hypothetical protein